MTQVHEPINHIKEEMLNVNNQDSHKVEKKLQGTFSNLKYAKENNSHHHFNNNQGWKDSRSFKGKNFSDQPRIEYIKEKKRLQSSQDKALNVLHPERNQKAEKEATPKLNQRTVIAPSHGQSLGQGFRK